MNSPEQETAGIVAPPPVLYLGVLAIGFLAQVFWPKPLLASGQLLGMIGGLLFIVSAGLARWAFVVMRRIGTSADPRSSSSVLATGGPFRLSRNPIYVAMTGLYLGISLVLNSWWPVLLLVPLLLVMDWGVVRREERYLLHRFGEAYSAYKAVTRRWL